MKPLTLALFLSAQGEKRLVLIEYANMKELRFKADGGVWRVAFAFDPETQFYWLLVTNPEQARKSFIDG
jgi:hypothetical protein